MIDVYFYMPESEVSNAVECGLKLSRWAEREVSVDDEVKKCMTALLNPKDDMNKYRSSEYRCVKLEVPPQYCFVADKYLYLVGLKSPLAMELYLKSIVPIDKYIFGSYRLPECLVTSTVISGHIGVLDKRLDLPVLFNNSEELYINNIIETYREEHSEFSDALLYAFYCMLTDAGKLSKKEDPENGIAIFIAKSDGRHFTVKIPDLNSY